MKMKMKKGRKKLIKNKALTNIIKIMIANERKNILNEHFEEKRNFRAWFNKK